MAEHLFEGRPTTVPRLDGRVALVTGASRGIGARTAVRLAAAGAAVAVTARTAEDQAGASLPGSLAATLEAISAVGGRGIAVVADLADAEDRARIVPAVADQLGPVDILVNNAAAAFYAPAAEMALRRRRLLFELNVHAPIDLVQAVVPSMIERRRGWIVNVSSATSRFETGPPYPDPGVAKVPYGASKAALERFTVGLAAELHAFDIVANTIAPVTGVLTEGAEALIGGVVDTSHFEPVEHLAEAVAYLASCSPAECTGQVLLSGPLLRRLGLLPVPPR